MLAVLFLILSSAVTGLSLVPMAGAVMQLSPPSPLQGIVGTNVTISGNLTTSNGGYKIMFDTVFVGSGTASGNNVNASFIVPEAIVGKHEIMLVDSSTNDNATYPFYVSTFYSINVTVPTAPLQLQEGDSIPIFLNVTGYSANATLAVNFTVKNPANMTFTAPNVNVNSTAVGSGNITTEFPENFQANGTTVAATNYVGTYTVTSSVTSTSATFGVGLTNSTQYHRFQVVNIRAESYSPNEKVSLNVTGSNVQYLVNLTADSTGAISYSNFSVPANASIGTYNVGLVSVSSSPTVKVPADTQNFTVPGFAYNVTAKNLAEETVPGAAIVAEENSVQLYNQTTNSNGLTVFTLEIGNYSLIGYYKGVEVGVNTTQVNGASAVDFVLNLTDLNIKVVAVVNNAQVGLPDASINLLPDNETLSTDINGNAIGQSLLPNGTTYILNATRYSTSFNVTMLSSLLVNGTAVPYYNLTIVSPSYNLQVNVSEAGGQAFSGANVEANELVGGIQYNGTTDANGIVNFNGAPFGEYDVEVLDTSGSVINTTTVDLFQDQNVTMNCSIYGFNMSVTVTDYFGQPFGNTDVTLQGKDVGFVSGKTQSNGTAIFENMVGGTFTISVYLSGSGQPTTVQNVMVNGTTAVSITLTRYVILAGTPVELTEFIVVLIIALTVLLVILLEIYHIRKKPLAQKASG
jgi:hypothetical protein